jgi:hypothetical protein
MSDLEASPLRFQIVEAAISESRVGDVYVAGPDGTVGVAATNLPEGLQLRTTHATRELITYRRESNAGIELVNLKVRCIVEYDGPQVRMSVDFPADGLKSLWLNQSRVMIGNPTGMSTAPTDEHWQALGVNSYPVIRVPVSVSIDHPWPADSYRVSFNVVLSGMFGFGAAGTGPYEAYQESWVR